MWDFGGEQTSTKLNPTHRYSTVGEYRVTLTVYNSTGKLITNKRQHRVALSTTSML
ncbi:MAG: PKD domain-containing protein [Paludibacteraceae bacterium]|nr:PKD domain-containing protein [Paludibacteraceae bacterium]